MFEGIGSSLKLALIINGLDSGGAEKSTLKMCKGFISDGHQVVLITLTDSKDFYSVETGIHRINLDRRRRTSEIGDIKIKGFRRLLHWGLVVAKIWRLRKTIIQESPDCVISMTAKVSVFTFLANLFQNRPQIGSERIHPNSDSFSHGLLTDRLRPWIYKHGMILSVQTQGVADWCTSNWKVDGFVTPNHLERVPSELDSKINLSVSNRTNSVLAISRDHPQKNLDFLFEVWAIIEKSESDAHLTLVGPENTMRTQQLALELQLKNVSIHSRTEHVTPYFNVSKVFVSTSILEGFPNVILEAISFGIPVVTTPSCDLVTDFARQGAAIVVSEQEPKAFANAILNLIGDPDGLAKMSHSAKLLSNNYSWESVRREWYACIDAAIRLQVE